MITPVVVIFAAAVTSALADAPIEKGRSECELRPGFCAWPGMNKPSLGERIMQDQVKSSAAGEAKIAPPAVRAARKLKPEAEPSGNLPAYMTAEVRHVGGTDGFVIVAEKATGASLPGLRAGDLLKAVLEQSIKASPSVPTPIRARVATGPFKDSIVLGTAVLDRELKRILVSFERLRLATSDASYTLKATGLAPNGQVGLEGEHHTQRGAYFVGELLASAAAGYADATTQRTQTILGGYQTEPSVGNATKQGAVTALSKTADRFAEQSRTAPEYTEIEGGREIQILIQETPTEVSGS